MVIRAWKRGASSLIIGFHWVHTGLKIIEYERLSWKVLECENCSTRDEEHHVHIIPCVNLSAFFFGLHCFYMDWPIIWPLTLKAPIATKVVCFSGLLKCLRSLYGKQCGPRSDCSIGAVCSGSTLFASILNMSVMQGKYLQQTSSADDIFRYIFFLAL